MRKILRKLYKIIPVSLILASLLLLATATFAGTVTKTMQIGENHGQRQTRVVMTRNGRHVVYRRINGRWVRVRIMRPPQQWHHQHRKMGDLGGEKPTYQA